MDLSFNKLIKEVHELNDHIGGEWNAEWQLLWIVEEIGEISRVLQKKESLPGKLHIEELSELDENLKEEIGDVIYGLISFCKRVNIDFKQALIYSLEKFKKRHQI